MSVRADVPTDLTRGRARRSRGPAAFAGDRASGAGRMLRVVSVVQSTLAAQSAAVLFHSGAVWGCARLFRAGLAVLAGVPGAAGGIGKSYCAQLFSGHGSGDS